MSENAAIRGCGFLTAVEIDRAVDGKLALERREEFLTHIRSGCLACAYLEADLDTFREVVDGGATRDERREFDSREPMLRRRLLRSSRRGKSSMLQRVLPAAAALVLVALTLVAVLQEPGLPGSTLALPDGSSWNVEPMPFQAPPTVRGQAEEPGLWTRAGEAYSAGRFAEADRLLAEIDPETDRVVDVALYRGICRYMLGNDEPALASLDRALAAAKAEDLPTGAITWFRGLVLVRLGRMDEARDSLERTRASGGIYAKRSASLLERLGR